MLNKKVSIHMSTQVDSNDKFKLSDTVHMYLAVSESVKYTCYIRFYHNEAIHQRTVLYDNYNTTL